MSLHEVVTHVGADQAGSLHFIAIGGAGMSGIANMYQLLGSRVSGCDSADSPTLRQLAAAGISTHVGHDPAHVRDVDTIVVSSVIRANNPELVAAREAGKRVWHRSTALAALMMGRTGISVAGAHGKTTTSAMTAVMLQAAGADPSFVIGAPLAATGTSSHLGAGEPFVVEADESDGSFLQYPTRIAVITNIEADHLDNWGTVRAYHDGFWRFATAEQVEAVVINIDDPGARELHDRLSAAGRKVISYGEHPEAEVRLADLNFEGTYASATLHDGGAAWPMRLQVPGRYNLANAAAAFAAGRLLGLDAERLLAGAASFTGTLRRFQLVAEVGGIRVYDDYAHHPTELRAALGAALRARGEGRLVACFQPHLYSRTRDFADEFGQALCLADLVVVTDVYGAREDPMPGVSGALVADAAERHAQGTSTQVSYVPDKGELANHLAGLARPGDLIMTLGAGDVTLVGPLLAGMLAEN
jgi:UDP-N-acetylmuramate--alanine ligase